MKSGLNFILISICIGNIKYTIIVVGLNWLYIRKNTCIITNIVTYKNPQSSQTCRKDWFLSQPARCHPLPPPLWSRYFKISPLIALTGRSLFPIILICKLLYVFEGTPCFVLFVSLEFRVTTLLFLARVLDEGGIGLSVQKILYKIARQFNWREFIDLWLQSLI